MSEEIVRASEDGVEFFTVRETGKCGMSASGIAALTRNEVSQQKISRILSDLTRNKGPKYLESYRGVDLYLTTFSKRGGKAKVIKSEICSAILTYCAFLGSESALIATQKFATSGMDTWIQSITGWSQKAADTTRYLTGVVLIEPKQWERHFSAEWSTEAERLTGWDWQYSVMGSFINDAVYNWMPEEVREELDRVNPSKNGKRSRKQHQHFSEEAAPVLRSHIKEALTLMKAANSKAEFIEFMNRRWSGRYQLSLNLETKVTP